MSRFSIRRVRSITGHLFLYALALTLPILLVSGFIGWAYVRQEGQRIDRLAEQQAQSITSQIDNRLASFQATLDVLATSPNLLEGNMDDFRSRLEQTTLPPDVWFTVRDRNGQQLINTRTPRGARLPAFVGRGDPVIFTEGRPYTSDLIWAPVTKQWAVTLSVPVRVPAVTGEVRFALTIGVPATYFRKLLENAPQGWIAAINDRNGKILARSMTHDQWVGKPMAQRGWEISKDVPPGQGGLWKDVYTLEGTKVVGAYHRMESTGWLIGVSALPEIYEAPRQNIIAIGLTLLVMSLLMALALASLLGRRITEAINVLQVKAAAMRDVKVIDFPRTSLDEVNNVAEIMRSTAQILRNRQDQQTTLIQELNHRVKNTLATVQAISRMTIRNSQDMAAFEQAFSARLLALSATHDLLTASAWSGVELRDLLTKELEPFRVGSRLSISGPAVALTSKVAIGLGMAIHEMATNASKYGALRSEGGSIRIGWSVADGILRLDWRERCQDRIVPPTRKGFGSRLINQTIVGELQGMADMTYNEDGLQAVFTIPLDIEDRIETQVVSEPL
ncbi:sensor histidine kinase [Microvirga yunnanensis]|uniref:sensor histidine kinase n=1 Tax=Microvirga yunnanensis TaxID=2953740 RepID=UPI0021C7DFD5|nr:sensor histidine kinase [Microvirga sp. HBU65207]